VPVCNEVQLENRWLVWRSWFTSGNWKVIHDCLTFWLGRRDRRLYEITEQGRIALTDAKAKVKELFGELIEGH
jgi:hypothetical protein